MSLRDGRFLRDNPSQTLRDNLSNLLRQPLPNPQDTTPPKPSPSKGRVPKGICPLDSLKDWSRYDEKAR
jgi:hypothetical protein